MKGDRIKYRKGYKYSLWETYRVRLYFIRGVSFEHRLFKLTEDGMLTIYEDYPWDGASGPTIDTSNSMRGSLVHDALFEAMRLGLLSQDFFHAANEEFRAILLEDEMSRLRSTIWFDGVEDFGSAHAAVKSPKIYAAP